MTNPSSQPIRILLIDNDSELPIVMETLLERAHVSFELTWSDTCTAALDAIDGGRFDLCLMDDTLGRHSGIDLLRQIRFNGSSTPVIILAGRGDREAERSAMNAGASDYLVKGELDARLLQRSIRYALDAARYERSLRLSREELNLERAFIASVLDTTASLIVVLDVDCTIVRFNRACEELTGYRADEVLGKPIQDILLAPDEIELVRSAFNNLVAGLPPDAVENNWVTKNGERRLISWSNTTLLDSNGHVEYVIGTGTDITDRKRAEESARLQQELFRAFMDNTPAIAFIKDTNHRYVWGNRSFSQAVNGVVGGQVGATAYDFFGEEEADGIIEIENEILTKRIAIERIECHVVDGAERYWVLQRFPIIDSAGNVLIGGKGVEITRQKQAERALQEANDKLELRVAERTTELELAVAQLQRAHAAQKQFVADVSHDLRTPLTIIRGELDLLLENIQPGSRLKQGLRRAINGVKRINALSNDLLLLAQLDSHLRHYTFAPVCLDELLLEAISGLAFVSKEKEISWQVVIDETVEVDGDSHLIERAISNVLENAVKYSPEKSIVSVSLQMDGTMARITIADYGVGISPEELPWIFERFYRSDHTRSTQGSGLGLSIVQSVVDAHNGFVTIQSEQGVGTTLTISLPLKRPS